MTTSTLEVTRQPSQHAGLPGYELTGGVYDEMLQPDGSVRPAWRMCANWFASASPEAQLAYAKKIERLTFENFADPERGRKIWNLDLIPLIIDHKEWTMIEAAAIQRARLYSALLTDLYGEQKVLDEGLLPPTLVFSDKSYLRPLQGVLPADGHLTFLALDFARDLAGNWRIIDTHTETPAGHGFALANRMVLGEVAGQMFRQSRALRIGQFYQDLTDDLLKRAHSEEPTIAVLAPGPSDASFVGHSYMARYMGQMRVEGSDLRVVGNRVYLKTIEGLQKIDLLVRAVESHRADPLELAPDGFDGPVGLVEACRQNPDLIVNALGTAVVENRGLSGYLMALSKRLLGEDLLLADSPRLWLGDPTAREQVLSSLDAHIIHDAQEGTGTPGQAAQGRSAAGMTTAEKEQLISDISFNGSMLVAERPMGFATAPAWTPEGLRPEPYALRVFIAQIGGQFAVMPGGLALNVDAGSTVALSSTGGRSRDVWVTAESDLGPTLTLKRIVAQHATVQRHATELQSRVADNLFWLGRYCERADGTLRTVRQALQRTAADLLSAPASPRSSAALRTLIEQDGTTASFDLEATGRDEAALSLWVSEVCTNTSQPHGLPRTLANIKNIAVFCQDRLSEDSWRILHGLSPQPIACQFPPTADGSMPTEQQLDASQTSAVDIIEAAEDLIDRLSAFSGMTHENMTRNAGWVFLDLGRRIERAQQLSGMLLSLMRTSEGADADSDDMLFALQAADTYITFRSRYRFAPEPHLVLDLLVIDETNPRSLAYQLAKISEHIGQLPKSTDDAVRAPDQRLALELLTKVRLADARELATPDSGGTRVQLAALLELMRQELPRLSELISRQYFSLADEKPQRLHPKFSQ